MPPRVRAVATDQPASSVERSDAMGSQGHPARPGWRPLGGRADEELLVNPQVRGLNGDQNFPPADGQKREPGSPPIIDCSLADTVTQGVGSFPEARHLLAELCFSRFVHPAIQSGR